MLTKKAFHDSGSEINSSRRKFLGKIGGVAGITAIAVACQKSVDPSHANNGVTDSAVKDGSYGTGRCSHFKLCVSA